MNKSFDRQVSFASGITKKNAEHVHSRVDVDLPQHTHLSFSATKVYMPPRNTKQKQLSMNFFEFLLKWALMSKQRTKTATLESIWSSSLKSY